MKRRKFLEKLLKGTAAVTVTGVIANEIIETFQSDYPFVASGDIQLNKNLISDTDAEIRVFFDTETKTICFEPAGDGNITMQELYQFIRDEWESDESLKLADFPLKSVDKTNWELGHEYKLLYDI